MSFFNRSPQGFTLTELLVSFVAVASLAIWILSHATLTCNIVRGNLIAGVGNARQIHRATIDMVTDGKTNGDLLLGWPGDLKTRGSIATLRDYVNLLVRNDYLKPNDLKVLSCAGFKAYQGKLSSGSNGVLVPAFEEENCAFKVYLVKNDNPAKTLFLATKNYTYDTPLNDPNAKPFGNAGFVVIRKDGNAAVLEKKHAQNRQIIGMLPGGGNVESAENCLNPGTKAP